MTFDRNQAGNLVRRSAMRLRNKCPLDPKLAIVMGSGFHSLTKHIQITARLPYKNLPGFPIPSVKGHAGEVVAGCYGDVPILALCGRAHFYEGHSMQQVTFPVRVLAEFGIETLLLTNAAGAINPKYRPGNFMCIQDHINFMGINPLRGECASGEDSFLDQTEVYDRTLIRAMRKAGQTAKATVHSGVYIAVSGPSYETPSEIRAFARLGADAVGMSTVPEAMVAHQSGMRVAALSCITNMAAGANKKPISHKEVLSIGKTVQTQLKSLVGHFVRFSSG